MKARSTTKTEILFPRHFDHHKLEVYTLAISMFGDAYRIADRFRRGDFVVRDQFIRAALSVPLNISEGSSEWRPLEKARLYRVARRSAGECAAVLDAVAGPYGLTKEEIEPLYEKLVRIMTMLMKLIQRMEERAAPAPRKGRRQPMRRNARTQQRPEKS